MATTGAVVDTEEVTGEEEAAAVDVVEGEDAAVEEVVVDNDCRISCFYCSITTICSEEDSVVACYFGWRTGANLDLSGR